MLRTLRTSLVALAAASALAAPVVAQTTATPPAATATAPAAAPSASVPASLTDLGITDARISEGRRGGQRADGTLPGGQKFKAMLDAQSQLRMISVDESAALPADILSRLVPDAVRTNAIYAEFAVIRGVGRGDQGVTMFGTDAQGNEIRAGFSTDGTLQRFGRGDMDRRDMHRGDDGPDRGHHDGKREGRKDRRDDQDRRGPDAGPAGQPGTPLDDAAIQGVLRDGGYTQPGAITRNGPRVEVEAMNPEGEAVTVTINPRGVVVRELAR